MRCHHPSCKKKLTCIMRTTNKCRCDNIFCTTHRLPDDHKCLYNYNAANKELLKKSLVPIIHRKIIAI